MGFIQFASAAESWWPSRERTSAAAKLEELKLYDLQVEVLEAALQEAPANAKPTIAGKLALAISLTMDSGGTTATADEQAKEAKQQRLAKLLADYPQAATSTLQLSLLEQDYQAAERQVSRWLEEATITEGRRNAREAIEPLLSRFLVLRDQIVREAEALNKQLEEKNGGKGTEALEAEIATHEALATKLNYLFAWAQYYSGLTQSEPSDREKAWNGARVTLHELLGFLEGTTYDKIEAASLGLEVSWRSRAVIALGLVDSALANQENADIAFSWLADPSVKAELFDQARYWRLQGLLYSQRWEPATKFVAAQPEYLTGSATPGKASFAIALIRGGVRANSIGASAPGNELIRTGIAGLARLKQTNTLSELSTKLKLSGTPAGKGIWLAGMDAMTQFQTAEKSKDKADYLKAETLLSAALTAPEAKTEAVFAAELRYELAWCEFRLERFEASSQQFRQVVGPLRRAKPEMAQQAGWMVFASLQQLADKDPKFVTPAVRALDTFVQDFPTSSLAAKAGLYRAKLTRNDKLATEAAEKLAKLPPSDPTYREAQAELALNYKQQLDTAISQKKTKEQDALRQKMLAAIERYLELPRPEAGTSDQSLTMTLLALGQLREPSESNRKEFEAFITRGKPLALALAVEDSLRHEWLYRAFQWSSFIGDSSQASLYAEQLLAANPDSPFAAPALISQAKKLDEALAGTLSAAQRTSTLEKAAAVYRQLRKTVSENPQVLKENKNASAIVSRLAQYEQELGHADAAAAELELLRKAFPTDKKTLLRLMLVQKQRGQAQATVDLSRQLLTALTVGSDEWLSAKYHQIWGLAKTEPEKAKQVLKQLKVLLPVEKWNNWREQLQQLEQELGS